MKKLAKYIYEWIPLKRELFSAVKAVYTPAEPIYRHLHFKGVINVPVNKDHSFKVMHHGYQIENEIFWAGLTNGWERESIRLWIRLCEQSNVVLDIGANTGIYALIAKAVNADAKVFAFEPVKRVYEKLINNTQLNGYDIMTFEKAVSNADGKAVIYDTDTEHTLSVAVNKNVADAQTKVFEIPIETITLNSFVRNTGLSRIDLMKIDVETHEAEVLEGFSEYLAAFKPTLLIEILNDEVAANIEAKIKDLDYLYFNIDENKGIRQVEKLTASDYYNFLLCNRSVAAKLGLIS
jgi:FkbM family methyltransferase